MDVSVIIGANTYSLTDGTVTRLSAHDGLGISAFRRLEQRGPQQHGATDLGVRLDPRIFSLVFAVPASSMSSYYDNRDTLARYFRPLSSDAITFAFTLDNGDVRNIDCHTVAAPWSYDAAGVSQLSRVAFQFKAPDPTLYHPTQLSEVFSLGGSGDSMDIPLAIPWKIGISSIDQTSVISYAGSWESYPIVRIVGPITSAKITNSTTSEKLDFTGVTIAANNYYDIDCSYGKKTVKDSSGTNKIADLSNDSDLGTFHLEPPTGSNTAQANNINVYGTSITQATQVHVQYKIRYIGL